MLITQFRAGIEEEFLKKVEAEGGSFMPIQVDDNQGYWIRGAHALFFVDGSGMVIADRTRVAGNVLMWSGAA